MFFELRVPDGVVGSGLRKLAREFFLLVRVSDGRESAEEIDPPRATGCARPHRSSR